MRFLGGIGMSTTTRSSPWRGCPCAEHRKSGQDSRKARRRKGKRKRRSSRENRGKGQSDPSRKKLINQADPIHHPVSPLKKDRRRCLCSAWRTPSGLRPTWTGKAG